MTKMATPVEPKQNRFYRELHSRTEAKGGIEPPTVSAEAPVPFPKGTPAEMAWEIETLKAENKRLTFELKNAGLMVTALRNALKEHDNS